VTSATQIRAPRDPDDGSGPQVTFTVQSWRRIVRDAIDDPGLESLPCRRDLLLVAYDFASLCDVAGRGAYSSEPRKGNARSERPDASLCEFTEIGRLQVAKMLKLLIALGLLRQVRKAQMNQQAVYVASIPPRGYAEIGECLAVAAALGFKPRAKRDTSRASEERRRRKAHDEARQVLDEVPQTAVDEPVDNPVRDVVPTTSLECRPDDVPPRRADDVPGGRADDAPLPIGVLGSRGTISSHLGTGPWSLATGAGKEDHLVGGEESDQPSVTTTTIDGSPAENRWGAAVSQQAIRQTGRERAREERASVPRCQGLTGNGCAYDRPISPSNDKDLCLRCHGDLVTAAGSSAGDQPLSFEAPEMPPPNYGTEDGADS
jgi:hypothetical protein